MDATSRCFFFAVVETSRTTPIVPSLLKRPAVFAALLLLTTTAHAEDSETYFRQGNYYYELGMYEQAIQCYDLAILFNPLVDDAATYNNRGNAYAELRQYRQAIQDYSQAIRLAPNYAEAYSNRVLLTLTLGNTNRQFKIVTRQFNLSRTILTRTTIAASLTETLG